MLGGLRQWAAKKFPEGLDAKPGGASWEEQVEILVLFREAEALAKSADKPAP